MFTFLIFKSSVTDLAKAKIRTLLTSLGILIGVMSVVLLMAFGQGLKNYVNQQFEDLGTNVIYVYPGQPLRGGSQPGGGTFGGAEFDDRDLAQLERLELAKHVVPVFVKRTVVEGKLDQKTSDLYATTPNLFTVRSLHTQAGRLFTDNDLHKRVKVVVVGPKVATELFGTVQAAINQKLQIENQRYTVIGVLEAKGGGGLGGPDFDSYTYTPYTAASPFNPKGIFFSFFVQAQSAADIPVLKKQIEERLLKRYDQDDFSVIEQTEILDVVGSVFGVMNTVLLSIGSISLVVGGIGIMNIMYAMVTERIAEIGIRRALGATKQDILGLFLTQATVLALVGGILGLLLATGIVAAIQPFFPASITLWSVLVALGVSSGIGIFFGVFPATKAAKLSPIEAIRYE